MIYKLTPEQQFAHALDGTLTAVALHEDVRHVVLGRLSQRCVNAGMRKYPTLEMVDLDAGARLYIARQSQCQHSTTFAVWMGQKCRYCGMSRIHGGEWFERDWTP